jgi:hypothetical protein
MPSPFPGMDPYLEGELWQEFHETLASAIRAQLMPQLAPKYVALLAKRYLLDRPALGVFDAPPARLIYPDVHVVAPPETGREATPASAGRVAAPTVELPSFVEAPQLSVEIRDVAQRRLVTVIEILSPANKWGDGAREYGDRRIDLLRTQTHLLELDLLRGGMRIALLGEPPPAPYYVYLSRADRRPFTQVWSLGLRGPLPTLPVPLLHDDPDATLDLQAAIVACFDLVGYDRLLPYTQPPPPPELAPEDAAWLEELLAAAGWRG